MTARTATLTDFLLARIAEDEAVAKSFQRQLSIRRPCHHCGWTEGALKGAMQYPERVLDECRAKRRLIENATYAKQGDRVMVRQGVYERPVERHPYGPDHEETIAILAAIYADHPDYREEWRA